MFRITLAAAVAVLLSACASVNHAPISAEAAGKLQGKKVAAARGEKPDFTAFTAGKAAFAVLGAAAMISEGNAIVKDNEIADPALNIAAQLQTRLAAAKATQPQPDPTAFTKDDVAAIVAANPGVDYVLDVRTLNWMFNYYPTDWAHYRITYGAKLRLIDVAAKSVVAESACSTVQGDDKNPPSKDQLLENKAALLKSYLEKAATACTEVLARDVLKI